MSTGTEDFDKLAKLLKLKRHEQPPPGYFNHFSDLVINRLEKDSDPHGVWIEVPWLRKLFSMFESSPTVAGLFGAAICGLVIFGIATANQPAKTPVSNFAPVAAGTMDPKAIDSLALNGDSHTEVLGQSTDAMFGSNSLASPSMTAQVEPVSFSPAH